MEKYTKLKQIILEAEEDFSKFFEKDNKAAGTRARKAMQEVKNLAQDIRKDIQSMKNEG
ncbi:MAG: histone H1 [Bacteroidota bacterium]